MTARGGHTTTPAVYPEPTATKEHADSVRIVGEHTEIDFPEWNYAFTDYRGTAEDLMAVGILPAEMLAAVGKSGTKSARILGMDGEKYVIRLNRVGRGEWEVHRRHKPDHPPYTTHHAVLERMERALLADRQADTLEDGLRKLTRARAAAPSLPTLPTSMQYPELFAIEGLFEGMRDWIKVGCPSRDNAEQVPWTMRQTIGFDVFGSSTPFEWFFFMFREKHSRLYAKMPRLRESEPRDRPAGSAEDYFDTIYLAAAKLADEGKELWGDDDTDMAAEDLTDLVKACTEGAAASRECFEALQTR